MKRKEVLLYNPHPSFASLRARLARIVGKTKVAKAPPSVTDMENLRRLVHDLTEAIERRRPRHVIIVASGAVPFGFAVMHVLSQQIVDGTYKFHLFPGPRWDSEDSPNGSWREYFVNELKALIGPDSAAVSRLFIIDTTSTGSSSFDEIIRILGILSKRVAPKDILLDYALIVNKRRAKRNYGIVVNDADAWYSIRNSDEYPVVINDPKDRRWTPAHNDFGINNFEVAFFGVPYLFTEDASALIGLEQFSYLQGGVASKRARHLRFTRQDGSKSTFASPGLDTAFVNLLTQDDESSAWTALHAASDDLNGVLIDEPLSATIYGRSGDSIALELDALQQFGNATGRVDISASSSAKAEEMQRQMNRPFAQCQLLEIAGWQNEVPIFIEVPFANITICPSHDGRLRAFEYSPGRG